MKNIYEVLEISVVTFGEDIITESIPGSFDGAKHGFGDPNEDPNNGFGE